MNNPDWMRLTPKQREDVTSLHDRMNKHLITEMEAFYKDHPGLRLHWAFVCDALIRVDSTSIKVWNDVLVDEWAITKDEILSVLNRLYNYYDGRARAAVRTSSGNAPHWEAKRDVIEKVAENLALILKHRNHPQGMVPVQEFGPCIKMNQTQYSIQIVCEKELTESPNE